MKNNKGPAVAGLWHWLQEGVAKGVKANEMFHELDYKPSPEQRFLSQKFNDRGPWASYIGEDREDHFEDRMRELEKGRRCHLAFSVVRITMGCGIATSLIY